MAEYLDPMGMQTGYDDSNVPKPSQDEMRLALSKKKTSPLDAVASSFKDIATRFNPLTARKTFQEALMPYTEPVATALSAIPAAITGGAYGIAKGLASPEYGTPAVTNVMEQAAAPVVQAMTYQPRTEEGAANLDMILNNEFMRKMPPLLGPYTEGAGVAPLRFAPSDLRAMIGKGQLTAQELANFGTDFRNAEQGIYRENILGEKPLGSKAAKLDAEIRKAYEEGKIPAPGLAIRNVGEGTVLKGKKVPNVQTSEHAPFTGFNEVLESARPLATDYPSDIVEDFTTRYIRSNESIDDAWKQFKIDKLAELYPDAPSPSAAMSAFNSVVDRTKRPDITLGWLKEFADQNPNVPGFDEYMARVAASDAVLEGPIATHIQRYTGTKEDPLLKAATEGLTMLPFAQQVLNNQYPSTTLQRVRQQAGFKPGGEIQELIEAQSKNVDTLNADLEALNQERANAEQQIRRDFPDVTAQTDPATYTPEYVALRDKYRATTNKISATNRELAKATQKYDNLRLGRAYELASDETLQPQNAGDIKRYFEQPGNYGEAQFFPGYKNFRPDEKVFELTLRGAQGAGYHALAQNVVSDIMSGKIPTGQAATLNIDKYVRTFAGKRLAEEAKARAEEAKKAEALKTYAKERIANVPDNLRFANSSVLELTSASGTVDEIRKDMALDTYCLDHCIGSGGSGASTRHFLTGDERTHTPVVDPVTGEVPALSSGSDRGYADAVARGEKIIPSFRDNETGFPVATLELTKRGKTKYDLGYKSGYQNRGINLKYAEDIKNYLNQKADAITDTGGGLSENTHVYDTMHHNDIGKAARAAGITEAERTRMDLSSLPRFITAHDLQILKNQQTAGIANMQTDLENLRREREGMVSYRSQASDPDFVDTQLEDIDSRIRDIEQRLNRPAQQLQPLDIEGLRQIPLFNRMSIEEFNSIRNIATDIIQTPLRSLGGDTRNRQQLENVINNLRGGVNYGNATTAGTREGVAIALQYYLDRTDPTQQQQQPAQQAVQPYREPTDFQRVMQVLRNESTQLLRDRMGDTLATEVDETANEIFGNYDHGTVADIIHGLRNGDATVANNQFSARQRELLARELERRLPRPANGDRQVAQTQAQARQARQVAQVAQQPFGPTQRTFAVNALANALIEQERTGRDYSVPGLQSTRYALANGMLDHPELTALPPEQRAQITRDLSTRFTELTNNLIRERAMQPIPLVRGMTDSRLVRRAYGDIIQEEQGDLASMRDHLAITMSMLDDDTLNADIIEELRANRHPERLTQLREMVEAHMDAVLTAINMNEEPAPGIGDFEPDTQHGANAPGLGTNPTYQIETFDTSLPRPVIDFLESFFRDNNIDSHPENVLEENYRDLLEQITRGEAEVEGLTVRQSDEAINHVTTVMENMGLNAADVNTPQAQLPPPAEPTTTTFAQHQRSNRAIVNAYTEPLQFASTPGSHRLMQATIDHVNTMANNMFGNGYGTDEIARNVLNALNTRRNETTRLRPEVLGVDRDSYNNFLEMLRYAVDDLGAVYGTIDPAQQAQLPAPAQQQQPPRPVHELYAELVGAIEDAIQEGSFDPDMYDNANMAEAIRNGEVGGELNEATPEELRLLADYVERNGFAPGNAPEQQQVANANVLPRNIQTASLTQLNGELSTLQQNEARELAAEAAHPNNANTPTDLRAIAQTARQYSQGQIWEDFNPAQRELLARALEQHATDIEMQQRPPGHKKGGYITRKPSIDEMRFALMKGK